MKYLIQIGVMFTDICILAALFIMTKEWGVIGLLIGLTLIWKSTMATGGFFYSWKPKNIKAFLHNFDIYDRKKQGDLIQGE